MPFGNLLGKLQGMATKVTRDPDVLQGAGVAIALVAAVGGITPDEERTAKAKAKESEVLLGTGFSPAEIERELDKRFDQIEKGGRSTRAQFYKELEDVRGKDDDGSRGTAILLIALDVADVGGLDDAEEKVLREIASKLGVNYDSVAAI